MSRAHAMQGTAAYHGIIVHWVCPRRHTGPTRWLAICVALIRVRRLTNLRSVSLSLGETGCDVTPVSTMLRTVDAHCLTTGRLRDKYHAHSLDLKVFFPPRVSWQTFRVIGEDIGIKTAVELGEKIFLLDSFFKKAKKPLTF